MTREHWIPGKAQTKAVTRLLEQPGSGLFLPPGMGKTSAALKTFRVLQDAGVVDQLLVICPLSVMSVWQEEAEKWDFCKGLKVALLYGPKKEALLHSGADVLVINYDGLPWLDRQRNWSPPKMLICDESTFVKNTRTQRFKYLKKMLKQFDRRVIMTGTPATNGLINLFGQLYVVDLGERLHPFVTRFRNEYFTQVNFSYVPHPDAAERIRDKIGDVCLYLDPKDYLDLPDRTTTRVPVELPYKLRKQYKALEDDYMLKLKEGIVTVANAATKAGKLRQFLGGALYLDDTDKAWEEVHDLKVEAALDRIESGGEPTFVLYEYDHERQRLEAAFEAEGWAWARVSGTPKKRKEAVRAWNAGELDILLAHPASAGHGLNLQQGGRRVLWLGPTWNLEHWIQANGRIDRQGQKEKVFVDVLCMRGTYDDAIMRMLAVKDANQNELFAALKEYEEAA